MRVHAVVVLLACASACSGRASRDEAQVEAKPEQPEQLEQEAVAKVEPSTPSEPTPAEPEPEPEPTPTPAAIEPAEAPAIETPAARRWLEGAHATPSRSSPPPNSVLGRLSKADAIALVVSDHKLELVAAGPSGWRLELAAGTFEHVHFEPASGLVFFYRDRSVRAIDLLEPLSAQASSPPVFELARLPADAPAQTPSEVILCFPPPQPRPFWSCLPDEPLPSDVDPVPEYLEINWGDEPSATWHVPLEDIGEFDGDEDGDEDAEQYKRVALNMVGSAWLQARADRRQHFEPISGSVHGFYQATPMPGAPALGERCLDAEDCGKSLPLGVSGWEWVVVGSDQGDLFHPFFAVYDPATKRWANWEQLLAGTAQWVPTSGLAARLDELGVEAYPLFDGGGRVFVGSSGEQLCLFAYDKQGKLATAVTCAAVGGYVAGFLSVSTELGAY
jgi:hypothetical protein